MNIKLSVAVLCAVVALSVTSDLCRSSSYTSQAGSSNTYVLRRYHVKMFSDRLAKLAARSQILASPSQGITEAIVNTFPIPASLPVPAMTGNTNASAYDLWNYYRQSVGLDSYIIDPLLEKAAAAHANYVNVNNSYESEGHYETSGRPGSTGRGPCEREVAAGFTGGCIGEEGSAYLFASLNIKSLMDAPYHRMGMLSNVFTSAGLGTAGVPAFFVDFGGYKQSDATDRRMIVYPYPGQHDSPRGWRMYESPSPLSDVLDGTLVGYPITIVARLAGNLEISDFKLYAPDGSSVRGRPISTYENSRSPLRHSFMWIPFKPLGAASTYKVEAIGALDGVPVVLKWSFLTQAAQNFTLTAASSTLPPNSQVIVQAASPSPIIANFSYSTFQGMTVVQSGPNTLTVSRNGTICNNCYATIYAQDENAPEPARSITIPFSP